MKLGAAEQCRGTWPSSAEERVAEPMQAVSSFLLPLHCVSSQLPAGGEEPLKLTPRVKMEALKTGSSLNARAKGSEGRPSRSRLDKVCHEILLEMAIPGPTTSPLSQWLPQVPKALQLGRFKGSYQPVPSAVVLGIRG